MKFSFDTETGGLGWYNADERAFLTTWSDTRGNDHLAHQDDARAMAAFKSDMERCDEIVALNAPFDVHQVRVSANGFDMLKLGKPIVDVGLKAKVAVPERRFAEGDANGYSLDALAKTYLPEDEQKISLADRAKDLGIRLTQKGGYYKLWQADPEFLENYAKRDTRATIGLDAPIDAELDDKTRNIWDLEHKLMPHMIRAEQHGVLVDQEQVNKLHVEYLAKRDAAYHKVVAVLGDDALGDPDDPHSKDAPVALRDALLGLGVPLYRTSYKTGDLSVDKNALGEFKGQFPVIADLLDYRTAAKFLSTYIEPMLGRERVHTTFNQFGPWTGRMSSNRPNMQNIPVRGEGSAELRKMFIPDPGYVWLISDFDQIELRLLAYYLNCREFAEKIEGGHDVFAELAADLATVRGYADTLGVDMDGYRKGTPGAGMRGEAKNGTYAICYGVGAAKLSGMLDLPPGNPLTDRSWKVRNGYANAGDPSWEIGANVIKTVKSWLPGYWDLMSTRPGNEGRLIRKARTCGHINTIMGRRQPINRDKEYVALSALIQGGAGDIFKQAVINVAEALAPLGGLPTMFVHDEIGSLVPVEHAEEALRLQDAAMEAAYDLRPRLSVTGTIAPNSYAEGK